MKRPLPRAELPARRLRDRACLEEFARLRHKADRAADYWDVTARTARERVREARRRTLRHLRSLPDAERPAATPVGWRLQSY